MAARSSTPEPKGERRRAARFQPAFGTFCRFRQPGGGEQRVALVWNISETGVSMLLADPPSRGSTLEAELTTESATPRVSVKLLVVHIREMPNGDYFLGAQLERPLSTDELHKFLAPPPVKPDQPHG